MQIKDILNNLKSLNNKNAIHAYLNADTEVTTDAKQYALINFNTIFAQKSNKLALENGKIVIGKGIKKIKVSSVVTLDLTDNTNLWSLILTKNSNPSSTYQIMNTNAQGAYTPLYNEIIFEVEEGDTIEAYIRSVASQNIDVTIRFGVCQTHIIVEEI